ncbi:MAG: argininosuccinate lyase [Deltaproteobacteria bacterium]|nr:argininosuccinate lyase [Deltaproteobacteria bacterium]MBW2076863.1 argininosuccinate lyase [Deltaproteobacteria bacterium]MBW2311481.1 argininosuccinate lyase [Deltaproteobacteria bacterium]RLB29904.1 MAG: argininosuccinate lyase [Deltaproteobacteria bacterium]
MNKKLWQKRYQLNKQIEDFTVGDDYILDRQLVRYDCLASIAHAQMLGKIGILSEENVKVLVNELEGIILLDKKGKFKVLKGDEDCHTAIENHLIKTCGHAGKMIHTFRSRNDQVLAALRLLYKDELLEINALIIKINNTISQFKKRYMHVKIPGFTHTRKAMPSSIELWSDAIIDSMKDNQKMLMVDYDLIDQSPLGTGAGYGIPFEIDRQYTAHQMGFGRVQENSIYAQNSRGKFESTMLHTLSLILLDINKIASDLILFTLPELAFFELPDEFLTGSSMMPQKKNPDVLELLRSNYHIIVSYEFQVKNIIANLISGYHRDFQQTKGPTLRGFEITKKSLSALNLVFENLRVNEDNCTRAMTNELFATEKAYQLVKQGIPFREAYLTVVKELSDSQ